MARVNPAQFIQQVRAETAKVVWPTRRETLLTTVMVFVMAAVAAIFFFFVDWLLGLGVDVILTSRF
ncbi:preprotein translocase subunit SecE [Rubrimonas cliftonensis]|uniref:Protein translocase subunit SecE n=1 Tax=Rubrimonas cliftonensis TaxID=89524 RepID=A0A1H4ASE4_9RHOB|nr:preprotein translocase subunit SecE [Rubrimonas cliftonensis]SEA38823.1 protein translocase subunit secE/sec61 gamma [Rubrimonas cliftonensis]